MVADILSNVLEERNTPAFEATAQVSTDEVIVVPYIARISFVSALPEECSLSEYK